MRNYSLHNTVWKNRGHELDALAEKMLDKNMKWILIGNQEEKNEFQIRTNCEMNVVNDEEAEKIKDIVKAVDLGVICLSRDRNLYEKHREEFERAGIEENDRFFQGEVFQMVFDVYKHGQIKIDRIEVFMTSNCTLNCEKCVAYIPYFKHKVVASFENLKQDMDLLFGKVDYVFKLKLLGGECFLHPDLIAYVDYIYSKYHKQIGSIRIGTNGTIMPSDEIVSMCKRNEVIVDISDYSQAVPELNKLEAVKEKLLNNGVMVDIKRTGEQWLDMGFPDGGRSKIEDEDALRAHFEKCAMFCRQFADGKLFYCCSNCAAVKAGLYELNENDYFDFNEDFELKELLEYELGYSKLGHTSFCSVCQGGSDEANPHHVEVAKQVEKTVMRRVEIL